jgi:branched-chain amino acid transport system ATP-binding protein
LPKCDQSAAGNPNKALLSWRRYSTLYLIKSRFSRLDGRWGKQVLQINDVHAGYGNLKILRGVNMQVPTGGIVTLLGGNGTGKSTLLKAVSGLIPLMEGEVLFDGVAISKMKPHERMRLGLVQVTQAKEAYPAMTVEENLVLGAYTRRDRAGTLADLERVYEFFPVLRERRKQLSGTLSGGEVQMLVIGRGLMAKPKMLMLDEPSAALAPKVVLEIFANINRIAKTGVTILVVEQNVRMALILAQYGYIIRDGVIMMEGEAKKLISDPAVKESFLGGSVANTAKALRN